MHPATAIIPTLRYYDPTVQGYTFDLAKAEEEFKKVPGLWDAGFTLTILYNTGNLPRQTAAGLLKEKIEGLNRKFHVNVASVDWRPYLRAAIRKQLANFIIGWLADFPDAHNFASPFYASYGTFAAWQTYSNPNMDALIEAGIAAPEGPERQAIYTNIQKLAVEDCPSTTIDMALGRHWERDWVAGWYYNPIYPGVYAYNLWKWYYVPHSLLDAATQPASGYLPVDVNYDGKVDIKDIATAAKSFGTSAGPPIHPRWIFRCDVNNDRKIDIRDIALVAKNFGKSSATWVTPVPAAHDLLGGVDAPASVNVTKTPTAEITAIVKNFGTSDEANVNVVLYINGTEVHRETVATLASGATYSFVYTWSPATPATTDTYEIEVRVTPVAGEENTANNNALATTLVVK
jgi:hypothetical protein